jgi:hypothetical protein
MGLRTGAEVSYGKNIERQVWVTSFTLVKSLVLLNIKLVIAGLGVGRRGPSRDFFRRFLCLLVCVLGDLRSFILPAVTLVAEPSGLCRWLKDFLGPLPRFFILKIDNSFFQATRDLLSFPKIPIPLEVQLSHIPKLRVVLLTSKFLSLDIINIH